MCDMYGFYSISTNTHTDDNLTPKKASYVGQQSLLFYNTAMRITVTDMDLCLKIMWLFWIRSLYFMTGMAEKQHLNPLPNTVGGN